MYHDPVVYTREQKRVFGQSWQVVGFTKDVANHQDFLTRDVGDRSVVVQNFDGTLRAFTNVCSHRFNRILTACKGNGLLRCEYHGWQYNADGLPTVIPKKPRFDGLTPAKLQELRLEPWRVETCGTLVFVCRSPQAPSLREYLGASYETVEKLTLSCGPMIDENVYTLRANWKLLIENVLEGYHLNFVHPKTFALLGISTSDIGYQPPHSWASGSLAVKDERRTAKMLTFFESRPYKVPGYFHQIIFPNLSLATMYGVSFSIQFYEPLAADLTRLTSWMFQTRLDDPRMAASTALEVFNQSAVEFNRTALAEDNEVVEHVQLGVRVTNKRGLLSDEEYRIHDFQKHYLTRMEAAD